MLLLLACAAPPAEPAAVGVGVAADSGDSADTVEIVGAGPSPCPWPDDLYDDACVVRYALTLDEADWQAMQDAHDRAVANCGDTAQLRDHHPAVLDYGDDTREVLVRLKGNPCTFRDGGKLQFRIDLNAVVDEPFHDVTSINLEAADYDPTGQKNGLAYSVLRDVGLVQPRANFAALYVNGAFYAVYENIEQINGQFLDNHYEDSTGNLYFFIWNGAYGELRSNEDTADVSRWTEMAALVDATPDQVPLEEFEARFAAYFDIDELLLAMAAEAVIPQVDGVWAGSANCYVYDDPLGCGGAGCMQYLPWDLDSAFIAPPLDLCPACGSEPDTVTADPFTFISGRGPAARWRAVDLLLEIPGRRQQFLDDLAVVLTLYDVDTLSARHAARFAAMEPYQRVDAKVDYARFVSSNEELAAFFAERRAFLEGWLITAE